jgi:hypothetical protein
MTMRRKTTDIEVFGAFFLLEYVDLGISEKIIGAGAESANTLLE